MKIGSYVANAQGIIPSVKLFKPTQVLLFDVHRIDALAVNDMNVSTFQGMSAKVNVTLQDSVSGSQTTVVPFIRLNLLSEIATMHEGCVIMDENHILFPVLLHPTANLRVDNNKYLDIEMSGLEPGQAVDMYSEDVEFLSDMVCVYQKFSIPNGCARQSYSVGTNDILSFPTTGFDTIRITYASGVVSDMCPRELEYLMAKNNDLTLYSRTTNFGSVNVDSSFSVIPADGGNPAQSIVYSTAQLIMSHGNNFILDLSGIKSFEFVRDSNPDASFEFVMGDLH